MTSLLTFHLCPLYVGEAQSHDGDDDGDDDGVADRGDDGVDGDDDGVADRGEDNPVTVEELDNPWRSSASANPSINHGLPSPTFFLLIQSMIQPSSS